MNGRFPIALHIMTLLCQADDLVQSDYLAGSININPVLVRKELGNLIKKQLVASHEGKKGGYKLARAGQDISLASIYEAVRTGNVLGRARNTPNPACPVGKQINQHLDELYADVDKALIERLGTTTLAAFCRRFT